MITDAKFVIDKENFFQNILNDMKKRMEKLGSKKVFLKDGSWYWDLKPDYKFGEEFEI
jgi:hypothetical protein